MGSICITSNTGQHFRNIARSMELSNKISDYIRDENVNTDVLQNVIEIFITLLSPLAPHFSQELWEKIGKEDFVYNEKWPEIVESEMNGGTKKIPIQVNGKLRGTILVLKDSSKEVLEEMALKEERIIKHLEGKEVVKVIAIPNRIVNIVVREG